MTQIEHLIRLLARLPGFGPRSARRAVLHLLKHRETTLRPLAQALLDAVDAVQPCTACGNLAEEEVCPICVDPKRDGRTICVVEDVADLWALERGGNYVGFYHVLGGRLSALDGIGPEALGIDALVGRVRGGGVEEVILAMNLTVEGQTTAHYIAERLTDAGIRITRLAHGIPVGGELDYLDDGTLETALNARSTIG